MEVFNQDKKQPKIQALTNIPIAKLTDEEMAMVAAGFARQSDAPGRERLRGRSRG